MIPLNSKYLLISKLYGLLKETLAECFAGQLPPDIFGHARYTIDIGQNDFTSNLGSLGVETVKPSLPSVVKPNLLDNTGNVVKKIK